LVKLFLFIKSCLCFFISFLFILASIFDGISFASSETNSIDYVHFPSGATVYSPINRTYHSNFLYLNLTFGAGLGIRYSLNYSIDGEHGGSIPLVAQFPDELHVVNMMTGLVALPELSEGSHLLTINVLCSLNNYHGANPPGLPFTPTCPGSSDYTATYSHALNFTIDTSIPEFSVWIVISLFLISSFVGVFFKKVV
jgi:hypothetical protein